MDELDVSDHLMDLIHWEFEEQQYLDLKPLKGLLHEVACRRVDNGAHRAQPSASAR
ncbi:MAG: hypothetical protein ACXVR9_11465 [Gaiellaceae bacterium]